MSDANQQKRFRDHVFESRVKKGFTKWERLPEGMEIPEFIKHSLTAKVQTRGKKERMYDFLIYTEKPGHLPSDEELTCICLLLDLDYHEMLALLEVERPAEEREKTVYPLSPAQEKFLLRLNKIMVDTGTTLTLEEIYEIISDIIKCHNADPEFLSKMMELIREDEDQTV